MFTIAPADLNQVRFLADGSPVGVKHFIDFGTGTGTIQVENTNANDGSGAQYNAFQIVDLVDVSKITFTSVYTEPIAGRTLDAATNNEVLPLGGAFQVIGDETEGMLTIGGAVAATIPTAPYNFSMGVGSAAPTVSPMVLTPTSPLTFDAEWTGAGGNDQWSTVRGWDIDGGGFTASDVPLAYATTFSYMLTPTGGGVFDRNAQFIYSLDGQQYEETLELASAIPEPSRASLLLLSLLPVAMRRRRS